MGRIDRTPGNHVGDITDIELPYDYPSRAPRASIPYLLTFESTSKDKVGF